MSEKTVATSGPRVLGPTDGELALAPDGVTADRFMIDGKDSGGGFALVEHRLAPHVLAAPLHRHTREDEYSFVLEGRVGARWVTTRSSPRPASWSSSPAGNDTPFGMRVT